LSCNRKARKIGILIIGSEKYFTVDGMQDTLQQHVWNICAPDTMQFGYIRANSYRKISAKQVIYVQQLLHGNVFTPFGLSNLKRIFATSLIFNKTICSDACPFVTIRAIIVPLPYFTFLTASFSVCSQRNPSQ
jgi:hypothetical protein